MYDSRLIANSFLDLAKAKNDTLTPMQLIKLVYIAHGWCLALLGRPLVRDPIEAWQYGPVIPNLYAAVREFKSDPVVGPLSLPVSARVETIDEDEKDVVAQVYDIYGKLSGPALSRITHEKGSPWDQTYVDGSFGLRISNDLIEDYYARQASANDGAPP